MKDINILQDETLKNQPNSGGERIQDYKISYWVEVSSCSTSPNSCSLAPWFIQIPSPKKIGPVYSSYSQSFINLKGISRNRVCCFAFIQFSWSQSWLLEPTWILFTHYFPPKSSRKCTSFPYFFHFIFVTWEIQSKIRSSNELHCW